MILRTSVNSSTRRALRAAALVAASISLGSCSDSTAPRDQWLVEVISDAPVPLVGDRLLVEVLDEDGTPHCGGCRRQLGLSADRPWPISFGIAATAGAPPLLRVRLYRVENTGDDGFPLAATSLDQLVRLPAAAGVTRVGVELSMACLDLESDIRAQRSCDAEVGVLGAIAEARPPRSAPLAAWDPGLDQPCGGATPEGTVCVPSGAFIQGDAKGFAVAREALALPERLVVVSAFHMDLGEFTIGALKSLRERSPELPEPERRNSDVFQHCTYLGPDVDDNDAMPVNCISQSHAAQVCAARNMRLPTEAEWEFAAGNRELRTRYPWGDDDTSPCDASIHGLGPYLEGIGYCREQRPTGDRHIGPRAGTGSRDVTELGIENLAGGVAEWTSDVLVPYDAACWGTGPWLRDPRCPEADGLRAVRGGSWRSNLARGAATMRSGMADLPGDTVGFRCVAEGSTRGE